MRVFVTGVGGFVGRHLARYLLELGWGVWGTVSPANGARALGDGLEAVQVFVVDMTDCEAMTRVLLQARPDAVIHLAAVSSVASSWTDPATTLRVNVLGTLSLLDAVRKSGADALVISVGSSEEYGYVTPNDLPVTEAHALKPSNPYAVSKAAQGWLVLQYHKKFAVPAVHLRPFNHIGPGQPHGFIASDLASQIARVELGLQPPVLRVGNLTTRRDYLDVRDVVRAYAMAIGRVQPGEVYNLASGRDWSGEDILEMLLKHASVKVDIVVDPELLRPSDVPRVVGDASKFQRATGWQPALSLEDTLLDVLNYWRQREAAATVRG